MEDNDVIDNFLLNKVKEQHIINKIKFMTNPTISQDIKQDLSTFYFVWNAIKVFLKDEYITCVLFTIHKIAKQYNNNHTMSHFPQNANLIKYINFIKKNLLYFTPLQRLFVLKDLNLLKTVPVL